MINFIKTIGAHLNTFHECLNEELPLNFDYNKKVGMYYNIPTFNDMSYKEVFTLEIHFISHKNKKLELLELVQLIDSNCKNKIISNYWIKSSNPSLLDAKDDEYEHWILYYNVNKY